MRIFDAKSPTTPDVAEIKTFMNEEGIQEIIERVRRTGTQDAHAISKIFIRYIYDQGPKKQETALSIAYELQGLRLELMKPNLTNDPLREKMPYPISILYKKVCQQFKLDTIKINSNRSAIIPPERSRFLRVLFSSKYGLDSLAALLDVPVHAPVVLRVAP